MSDLRMKGTVSAPVFCRMPGSHRPAVKIVCDYDGVQTSLYLTPDDLGTLELAYNNGKPPQRREPLFRPLGKPRRQKSPPLRGH